MKLLVVDASVAAKWFFPEESSEAAARLISTRHRLLAPDLIAGEFGSVVWKRVGRQEITAAVAHAIIDDFLRLPLEIASTLPLLPAAVALAIATQRTVYDCLYLALAISNQCQMVTADERLFNALQSRPFAKSVQLIGGME